MGRTHRLGKTMDMWVECVSGNPTLEYYHEISIPVFRPELLLLQPVPSTTLPKHGLIIYSGTILVLVSREGVF